MVGKNENIYVDSYQNIVVIDPNVIYDDSGVPTERLVDHENLVMYANLTVKESPRTRLLSNPDGLIDNRDVSIASINYLKPTKDTDYFTTNYTDSFLGLNLIKDNEKNQEAFSNLLLISSIETEIRQTITPTVTMVLQDIRGRALFEQGPNSPYNVFFAIPKPTFILTLKGWYGKALTYKLQLSQWDAKYDATSGNFIITAKFLAYTLGVLNNVNMQEVNLVPYMYRKTYEITPPVNYNTLSASITNNGTDTVAPKKVLTTEGYEKLKEVYAEYKAQNLIPQDFPEIGLKVLMAKLNDLEKNLVASLPKQIMTPITDYEKYNNDLNSYLKEIYSQTEKSWFKDNIDPKNFVIDKNGEYLFSFKKEIFDSKNQDVKVKDLQGIIEKYNKALRENLTFGENTKPVVVGTKTFTNLTIPNNIKLSTIQKSLDNINIDYDKSFEKRTGQQLYNYSNIGSPTTLSTLAILKPELIAPLVAFNLDVEQTKDYWFKFEGNNSFITEITDMQRQLQQDLGELQTAIGQFLSILLEDYKYLGFKPLFKHIVAIIMANAEAFLRLMNDVHGKAWNVRFDADRRRVILGSDKTGVGADTKNNLLTRNSGQEKPVYPFPEYFTQNVSGNEKYTEKYPGDLLEISNTKAYDKIKWPEVEFVEEFIKAYKQTKDNAKSDLDSIQAQQTVNRVSHSALDYPTSNVLYSNQKTPEFLYEIYERPYVYGNYTRLFKPGYENNVYEVISESEFNNIQNAISQDSPQLTKLLKSFAFRATNYILALRNFSNSGTGESWQKFINNIFVTDYLQSEVTNSFGIYDIDSVSLKSGLITAKPQNLNKLKEMVTSKNINTFEFLDTQPFNLPDWYKTNLADGNAATSSNIYNTSQTYFIHDVKLVISNFNTTTTIKDIRPITSFNFYTPTQPIIESSTAASFKSFYENRIGDSNIKKLQATEGTVSYANYSGNISSTQTTSILNTPFFINSIIEGVNKSKINDENPYVSAAYLFLNSLPLASLREKYKTYNSDTNTTSDLDYIFASLKKFGAIHKLPYAWILKYGSIWHRYKKYYIEGVDILDNVWSNFDSVNQYDPINNNKTTTYSLLTPNTIGLNSIVLENVLPSAGGSLSIINNGFYPQLINTFNYFYRGGDMFSAYTNSEIQSKINSPTGITINSASDATINLGEGYSTTSPTDSLLYKTWSCTIKDSNRGIEYIVPSFGYLYNQAKYECLNNNDKEIQPFLSNYAIFNGGVRCLWALPNYGYYNIDETEKPSPNYYFKKILSGQSQQQAFSIQSSNNYTTIEELLSVFNIDIMNYFENEFLKFSQSSSSFMKNINNIQSNSDVAVRNFQVLMTEIMKVNYVDEKINANTRIKELMSFQFTNFNSLIKNFLEYDVIFKYGNPSNFDRNLFYIMTNDVLKDNHNYGYYVNGSLPTRTNTTNSLAYYISLNPQAWTALFTNIGLPTIDGLRYTNKGSAITDFFVDMNLDFTKENVDRFSPLIKVYATRKILNPNYNKTSFETELDNHQTNINDNINNILNILGAKLNTNLPEVTDTTPTQKNVTALKGETLKFDWWKRFKYLNDEYIAGSDYSKMLLFKDIMFLDIANRDIGDMIFFNPIKVRERLNGSFQNELFPVYGLLTTLAEENGFYFMNSPGYINWYNSPSQLDTNSNDNIANTIFGTYLDVDVRQSETKLIFTYAQENSKYLDIQSENYDYQDDSFDLKDKAKNTLLDNNLNKEDIDLEKSNKVVGFSVDIGIKNQNIFPDLNISMNEGLDTYAGAQTTVNMVKQENGTQVGTQSQSLYTYYRNKSYNCTVRALGNAMIQPTMYFNLKYVPLFHGTYRIERVKHTIQPGKFDTEFSGVRLRVLSPPKVENYLQMFFKQLYLDLEPSIQNYIDSNKKNSTAANSNPNSIQSATTNNQLTNNSKINPKFNSGKLTNQRSGEEKLAQPYTGYTSANPSQTTVSINELATGIKTGVLLPQTNSTNSLKNNMITDLANTKAITFITMYMESYNNNQFTTYNNNFAGAKLNYSYPGSLSGFFKNEYVSRIDSNDGFPYPYAVFDSPQDAINMLIAKWSPRSTTFTLNKESIAKAWITNWSGLFAYGKRMSDSEYSSFITKNPNIYAEILNRINSGLDLAKNLGLIDIYT